MQWCFVLFVCFIICNGQSFQTGSLLVLNVWNKILLYQYFGMAFGNMCYFLVLDEEFFFTLQLQP
jgi:hypothetical protein